MSADYHLMKTNPLSEQLLEEGKAAAEHDQMRQASKHAAKNL